MTHLYVFPTLVGHYQRECVPDQLDQELAFLHSLPQTENSLCGRAISTTTTAADIHLRPEMHSAVQFIQHCVDQYLEEIKSTTKLAISASWFNRVLPEGCVLKHRHKNSVLSGVMYYHNTERSPLVLVNPTVETDDIELDIPPDQFDLHNARDIQLAAEPGTVILFPSSIQHLVVHNPEHTPRSQFAFNCWPTDQSVGTPGKSNYCRL